MSVQKFSKEEQAYGEFNGGAIVENKPIGFPQEGGELKPFSNLFYWAKAYSENGSTIGEHPHQAFEILSFVLQGTIEHYDSHNNKWFPLEAGDVQIIRAGSGITHAERVNEDSAIFQIWFNPDLEKAFQKDPSYNDYKDKDFEKVDKENFSERILIGGSSPIELDSENINCSEYEIKNDTEIELSNESIHSVYVMKGSGSINGTEVVTDDYLVLNDEDKLKIENSDELKLFHLSNPKELSHKTYREMFASKFK